MRGFRFFIPGDPSVPRLIARNSRLLPIRALANTNNNGIRLVSGPQMQPQLRALSSPCSSGVQVNSIAGHDPLARIVRIHERDPALKSPWWVNYIYPDWVSMGTIQARRQAT